jgi:hypothetical protein
MNFEDLTTLDAVKGWLSLGGPPGSGQAAMTNVDDELLTRLITAASVTIQSWLNRSLHSQDWIEVRDGLGSTRFSFAAWPVTNVSQVLIAGTTVPPVPQVTPGQLWQPLPYQTGYSFTPTQLFVQGHPVPRLPQCVTLVYTAGYSTIPQDIEQACVELVAWKYRERQRIGQSASSTGGSLTVSYRGPLFARGDMLASDIQASIEQHQAVAPVAAHLQQVTAQAPVAAVV